MCINDIQDANEIQEHFSQQYGSLKEEHQISFLLSRLIWAVVSFCITVLRITVSWWFVGVAKILYHDNNIYHKIVFFFFEKGFYDIKIFDTI